MNSIGTISHPRYAQAFVDYLYSLGIATQQNVHPQEGVEIIVLDAEQFVTAQQELAQFLEQPNDARYWQASWMLEGKQQGEANAKKLSVMYRSRSLQKAFNATGLVNMSVLAVCTLVFIMTAQGKAFNGQPPLWFFDTTSQMGDISQWWRWIAPAFVHFGVFHFLFNMGAWWIFGNIIERTQSSARLLLLLITSGVISNTAQFFWSGNNFGGLSGVVYAVIGYLWFYSQFNPAMAVKLPKGLYVVMIITLVLGFTNFLPFANQAHLAGFLSGCVLGLMFAMLDRWR